MLKNAIYINVFLLFVMSIYFIIVSNKNNNKLRNLKKLIIVYIIYTFISMDICYSSEIVEIDWDVFYLIPISIVSLIIDIISICRINKLQKNKKIVNNNQSIKYIVIMVIPAVLFIFTYTFELYIINKCEYLLKYNYQNGIVISEDTYIAIINGKTTSVTLHYNIFDRKGVSTSELNYDIAYTNGIELSTRDSRYNKIIIENKDIEKIAMDAKERCPSAKGASIDYFSEGKYAIIELTSEERSGTLLGEYLYHNGKYVEKIRTGGSLEEVIYYKK